MARRSARLRRRWCPAPSSACSSRSTAFEREEQLHWERYLLDGPALARDPPAVRRPRDRSGARACWRPPEAEHAEVRVVDGRTYVSPWRMRLRVLAAMLSFREAEPLELSDRFVPKKDAQARRQRAGAAPPARPRGRGVRAPEPVARADPVVRAVRDDERRLGEDELGRTRLRYRTTTRRAIRRAEQAVPVAAPVRPGADRRAHPRPAPVAGARSTRRRSLELDYGGLCDFMTWDELDDDHSARDDRTRRSRRSSAKSSREPPTSTRAC